MPLLPSYPIRHATVHRWRTTEPSERLAAMCRERGIGDNVDARAESRRKELLAERLLLQEIFGDKVALTHNEDRAPFVNVDGRAITIAHTGECLLIAVADKPGLGIDVEHLARNERCCKVRKAFLCETERQWLPEGDDRHVYLWVAKEAIFKAIAVRSRVDSYRDDIVVGEFNAPDDGDEVAPEARFKGDRVDLLLRRDGDLAIAFAQLED